MNRIRSQLILLLFIITTACSPSTSQPTAVDEVRPGLEKYFQGFDSAFVMYDLNGNHFIRYNPKRCDERLLPASTFKIMNALIALETGVVSDENDVIHWDGTQYPIASWNQDHTLKTAFQNSVVWYYSEVARRVGKERMQQFIDEVGYGNQDIAGNIDSFWLNGAIRISANEQVDLLKRLYQNELPFSQRSMDIVKNIMIQETDSEAVIRGKTGSGLMGFQYVGWFVGYAEKDGNVFFFAANIASSDSQTNGIKAKEIVLKIFQEQGL